MENLFTIVIFIVIVLVKGLAAKKQSDRNRPVRHRRKRPAAAPMPRPEPAPVFHEEEPEDLPASLEEWLKKISDLENPSQHRPETPSRPKPPVQMPEPEPPVMAEKTMAPPERTSLVREEQVRASGQVMEKSVEAALPEVVKTAKTMTAPRLHPVRVSTRNLRRAVIMSEVLARPRAFDL